MVRIQVQVLGEIEPEGTDAYSTAPSAVREMARGGGEGLSSANPGWLDKGTVQGCEPPMGAGLGKLIPRQDSEGLCWYQCCSESLEVKQEDRERGDPPPLATGNSCDLHKQQENQRSSASTTGQGSVA